MQNFRFLLLVAAFLSAVDVTTVQADVVINGDVDPVQSYRWDGSEAGYIGESGYGTLEVNGGSDIESRSSYIGYNSGATGVATVDGAGSTWDANGRLYVGREGDGTLNIANDGAVTVSDTTYVAYGIGSSGHIHLDNGGTLTTECLHASPLQLSGNGTINTRGVVTDGELLFDSAHGLDQTFIFDDQASQCINVNLDLTEPRQRGHLGVGYEASGSMTIRDGVTVYSGIGYVGYREGATGEVTVTGPGSTWCTRYTTTDIHGTYSSLAAIYVGRSGGEGGLLVSDGGAVDCMAGRVGDEAGSVGTMTITGSGSTWSSSGLSIGLYGGNGTLNITDGAAVTVEFTGVADQPDSTGSIHLDGGGKLTTGCLSASPPQLVGTGSIDARGLISDVDLLFDSPPSLSQTVTFNSQADQNIAVNLDLSDPDQNTALGVGRSTTGTLTVRNGVTLHCTTAHVGVQADSTGYATISGDGSTWHNSHAFIGECGVGTLTISDGGAVNTEWYGHVGVEQGSMGSVTVDSLQSRWTNGRDLEIGSSGNGTLHIIGGASVDNDSGTIGHFSSSTGVVVVDGAGSTWTNREDLRVGVAGTGRLHINTGGTVAATEALVNDRSLLTIGVGNGSLLEIDGGAGAIVNDGTVRVVAGAGAAAGSVHSPIAATTFTGAGVYQAVGGTWDQTSHEFTVSDVRSGGSGMTQTIDLLETQRLFVQDAATGWAVGASFLAADVSADLDLAATVVDGPTLDDLETLLAEGESVLGGWAFTATGAYTEGDPAYLSFAAGPGWARSTFSLWHHDGTAWTEYEAPDLTYDSQYASFSVDRFSAYAVTVPEPSTLAVLLTAALGLLAHRQRKRRW